jgi:hypothetical protein
MRRRINLDRNKTMKTTLILLFGMMIAQAPPAQSAIIYTGGFSFEIPDDSSPGATIDFDGDGAADFNFSSGPYICTADYPTSACTATYAITALSTNTVLCQGFNAAIEPVGTYIGNAAPDGTGWTNLGGVLATSYISPRFGVSAWGGPLAAAGEGYLGFAFMGRDGLHYGWAHAWSQSEGPPMILDWAYESQPGTAIVAGAVPTALTAAPQIVRPGKLRLTWESQKGAAYQVQFKGDLGAPTWTNLDVIVIGTATNAVVDVPLGGASAGFYRVTLVN